VAKWFTGKTSIGIDGVGIVPDVDIPFDDTTFNEIQKDNQLEKALSL
jgi:C-terminal processing protease CtpA/Prc